MRDSLASSKTAFADSEPVIRKSLKRFRLETHLELGRLTVHKTAGNESPGRG